MNILLEKIFIYFYTLVILNRESVSLEIVYDSKAMPQHREKRRFSQSFLTVGEKKSAQ